MVPAGRRAVPAVLTLTRLRVRLVRRIEAECAEGRVQLVLPASTQMFRSGNPLPQGTRFVGDEGWVHVNRAGIQAEPASLLDVQITPEKPGLYESNNHYADFLDSVRKRRDPVAPVEAGQVASYLGLIAEAAGRLRRELRWDPAAQAFADDADANRLLRRPMRSPWRV